MALNTMSLVGQISEGQKNFFSEPKSILDVPTEE
jgi:hypothetical protein